MNIYWLELFLTVMQGDIGDNGGGEEGGEELGKQFHFVIAIGVQESCLST